MKAQYNKRRLVRLTIVISLLVIISSCSRGQESNPKILDKIMALTEFKAAEKRIDSLKHAGIEVEINISVIKTSLDPGDTGKDVSTAFINEDFGFDQKILYEVKFDSKTEEIISVKKNDRGRF